MRPLTLGLIIISLFYTMATYANDRVVLDRSNEIEAAEDEKIERLLIEQRIIESLFVKKTRHRSHPLL